MIDDDLTPQQRAELGDMNPLYERLSQYDVREPDDAQLLAALTPLVALRRLTEPEFVPERRGFREWLQLAGMQTELLGASFWWSTALLTLIGLLIGVGDGSGMATILLVLTSPLIAVAGVAYIFRPATRTLWELERLSRIHPLELLYARLALILVLNVALVLLLLVVVWI